MWVLYSGCAAVVLSVVIRLLVGRTSTVPPWRDMTPIVSGVAVGAAVCMAAAEVAHVEIQMAVSSALLWLTATITSVHALRESRRSHS
jgi:predicted membrane protein